MDQAPCGPAVPCLSRQARAAVMVRLRGEADAGHRSAVSGHRSLTGQAGHRASVSFRRQCHSRQHRYGKFPEISPSEQGCHISQNISGNLHLPQAHTPSRALVRRYPWVASATEMSRPGRTLFDFSWAIICPREGGGGGIGAAAELPVANTRLTVQDGGSRPRPCTSVPL